MALIDDPFTEATTVALTAHTPNNAGTSWATIDGGGTRVLNDDATDIVVTSGTTTGTGHYVASAPDPSGVEYTVGLTVTTTDTGSATRPLRILGRWADVSNHYHLRFLPDAHANPSHRLVKVVAGVTTELANEDTATAVNDVFVLSITDAAKSVTQNGGQILTSADNAIAAAGKAGFGMGAFTTGETTGNVSTASWKVDNYLVTELGAAVGQPTARRWENVPMMRLPGAGGRP